MNNYQKFNITIQSVLIATYFADGIECELRQLKNEWHMFSNKTGHHMIVAEKMDERVNAHWDGFKKLQHT